MTNSYHNYGQYHKRITELYTNNDYKYVGSLSNDNI